MKNTLTLGLILVVSPTAALATGVSPVPEPGSLFLLAGGLGALILLARRHRKR